MATFTEPNVSRITVELELANEWDAAYAARGDIQPDQIRHVPVRCIVDPGAALVVVPESVATELGLRISGQTNVTYADGRAARRNVVEPLRLTCAGRSGVFSAIAEPNRQTALIGAVVLEVIDLVADCKNGRLIPRDPDTTIHEIE